MIYIVDELISRPGEGEALLALYRDRYVRAARARGMTLAKTLVEPCFWRSDGPNRLIFLWSIADTADAWAKKIAVRWDEDLPALWGEIDASAVSRKRSMLCDADRIEELCDV